MSSSQNLIHVCITILKHHATSVIMHSYCTLIIYIHSLKSHSDTKGNKSQRNAITSNDCQMKNELIFYIFYFVLSVDDEKTFTLVHTYIYPFGSLS